MKNLIIFLSFIGLSLASVAQNDTTRYTMVNGYGFTYNRLKAKAALVMPTDTVQNKLPGSIVVLNDTLYVRRATRWEPVSGGGAGIPSGGTTGQILAKDSDTSFDVSWIDNYTTDVRETVKAATSINKGQAVYVSGADGTNVIVSKASNATEMTSSKTLGLLYQNLATNGTGFVIISGRLDGLNTSGATAGDPVWLGTNGNLLYGIANKPVAPAHLVYLGVVTRVNANNGEIFVHVQNGFEIDELHDVLITDSINNQILAYDSTTRLWKNKTIVQALGYTPVKTTDTSSMLTPYLRKADTTSMLANYTQGSGTINTLTKWGGSRTLVNSNITDNGSLISMATRASISGTNYTDNVLSVIPYQNPTLGMYVSPYGELLVGKTARTGGSFLQVGPGTVTFDNYAGSGTAASFFDGAGTFYKFPNVLTYVDVGPTDKQLFYAPTQADTQSKLVVGWLASQGSYAGQFRGGVYASGLSQFTTESSTGTVNFGFSTGNSGQIVSNSTAMYVRAVTGRGLSLGSDGSNDRIYIAPSGAVSVATLAGTGTRMVTADATGVLGTQAIPAGTVTSITAGTGLTGGTITSSGTIAADTTLLSTRAWRQKGIDSVSTLITARPTGTGTSNIVAKFITAGSIGNSQIFDNGVSVGINNTSPENLLHVGSSAAASTTPTAIQLDRSYRVGGDAFDKLKFYLYKDATQTYGLGLGDLADVQYWAGSASTGMHRFFTSQTERMRIFGNGRVFIGSSPVDGGYQVDIAGNLRTTTGANFATTSGSVGIGTATPNSKLELSAGTFYLNQDYDVAWNVAGSTTLRAYIRGTSGNELQFWNRQGGINTQAMTIGGTGNVGIATASPETKFVIADGAGYRLAMRQWSGTGMEINAWNDAYQPTIPLRLTANYLSFNTGSPNTEAMRIASNGNVVIGSGTTGYKLFVDGDAYVRTTYGQTWMRSQAAGGDTTTLVNIRSNANRGATIAFTEEGVADRWTIGTRGGNSSLFFSTGANTQTPRMTMFGNGRVGINTTTDAGYLVDVNGTLRNTSSADLATSGGEVRIAMADAGAYTLQSGGPAYLMSGANTALTTSAGLHYLAKGDNTYNTGFNFQGVAASDMFFGRAASSDDLVISTSNIGSPIERVRFRQNGNVGIGTASPADRLGVVVNTDAASGINISNQNTGSSARTRIALETQGGNWFLDGIRTGGEFAITRASTEAMRINGSGNVGFGTTTPTAGKVQIANLSTATMNNGLILTAADLAGADNGQRIGLTWGANTTVRASIGMVFENLLNSSNAYMTFGTGSANTERMRITSGGNVGIGTQSPTLEVNSAVTEFTVAKSGSVPANVAAINLQGDRNLDGTSTSRVGSVSFWQTSNLIARINGLRGGADNSGALDFLTNSAGGGLVSRLYIHPNGRIGANTQTDAGYQFDVNGNTRVTGKIDVTANTTFAHNVIRSGTLDVASQIFNSNGWFLSGAEGANGGAIFTGSTPYAAVLGSGYNRPLQLATNNTVRMEIDSVGLVGINTVTPTERLDVNGRARIRTVDSTATATNMLYVDNNGVVKKTSVPGTSLIMTESNATISTGWNFANNVNALNTNYLNKIEDQNSTYKKVTMQIAVYRTTSSFTTGAWQQIATLPADYAPTTTVVFELPGYVDGSTYYAGTTQFGSASEYTGAKVVRIDPSGNVQVRIGTVSASATVSGTNYVLLPINATWISTPLPL